MNPGASSTKTWSSSSAGRNWSSDKVSKMRALAFALVILVASSASASEVLLEAEGFADHHGWVLDPQGESFRVPKQGFFPLQVVTQSRMVQCVERAGKSGRRI